MQYTRAAGRRILPIIQKYIILYELYKIICNTTGRLRTRARACCERECVSGEGKIAGKID